MSIMVDWEIREAIESGDLVVDPLDESLINPASLDFRLHRVFTHIEPTGTSSEIIHQGMHGMYQGRYSVIDPLKQDSFKNITSTVVGEKILEPGEFVLATTLETFDFKGSIAAKVMGKSSLGRLGLTNSSQAGFIDPGFHGPITLELRNDSRNYIRLTYGMKIGQLVLYKTAKPSLDYKKTGRYSGQQAGQGSKGV